MENKKIGGILLGITVVLVVLFIFIIQALNKEAEALGCFEQAGCQTIETQLNVVHFAFGLFGFLLALGAYLVFFSPGENAIVERLERDTTRKLEGEKFSILLQGLDEFEKRALTAVREQEGITQNTLHLRTDMSKAKLSQVLSSLEKKGLVKREQQGKTLSVFFKNRV